MKRSIICLLSLAFAGCAAQPAKARLSRQMMLRFIVILPERLTIDDIGCAGGCLWQPDKLQGRENNRENALRGMLRWAYRGKLRRTLMSI
jgi:hypothetical protein